MHQKRPIGLLLGASLWASPAAAQEQRKPIFEITDERALALTRHQTPALTTTRIRARAAGDCQQRQRKLSIRRASTSSVIVCLLLAAALPACNERDESPPATEQADPASPAQTAPAPAADWCAGHGLPESKCTKCNPELIPRFQAAGDWCAAHGFPESACPMCNPQQPPGDASHHAGHHAADWCVEHAVPESKCTVCNPSLVAQFRAAGDFCEAHGFPESVCPVCNPQPPPAGAEQAAIEARVVRFRSPEIERSAGIQTVAAEPSRESPAIECAARIAFDADKVADIRAIVPGIVRRNRAELGARVKRGATLFELESTRIGEIQGALQTARERLRVARANVDRQRELQASEVISARQVEVAEQELASAQAQTRAAEATLRMAGAARSAPSGRYTLFAPIAGTVVRRPAVIGLFATASESLATIADTSVMWALCDVPEAHASRVAVGQRAVVTIDGSSDRPITGQITWIAAEVDPRTRTVSARADVPNTDGRLRANQFARARIETGAPRAGLSVPRSAVQRVGERQVVFVRTAQGVYEPRVVQRHGDGERVQIEGRVQPGDAVVTTGAVLLRTEIMPGSIGAGCCEVEPPGGE